MEKQAALIGRGGGIKQIGELRTQWNKFGIMMESHQLMIKDQVRINKKKQRDGVAVCTAFK